MCVIKCVQDELNKHRALQNKELGFCQIVKNPFFSDALE